MAFQTGSATSFTNLWTQLFTFLTNNGWTQDEFDTVGGDLAFHKNSIYVSSRWDVAGGADVMSLHQALGFIDAATLPGDHTDDSGNGYNGNSNHANVTLDNERCVNGMGDGPYPSYFFFENDASPAYCHVVVEVQSGVFRHFGFGELNKEGDWTGGEYVYGHYQEGSSPAAAINSVLLDGAFQDSQVTDNRRAATLHVEGLVGQPVAAKWGQVWGGSDDTTPVDDSSGEDKMNISGGIKAGPVARHFGHIGPAGSTSGLVPMIPIVLFHRNNVGGSADETAYVIGDMADVMAVNIKNFAAKEAVTIGSDTWYFFPMSQKTDANVPNRSYNAGIAYKRVDA